jgi:hypothetical protein
MIPVISFLLYFLLFRFLGSNTTQPKHHASGTDIGELHPDLTSSDFEISTDCWKAFQQHFSRENKLMYIDDSARERTHNFEIAGGTPPLLYTQTSPARDNDLVSDEADPDPAPEVDASEPEPVWVLPPPHSRSLPAVLHSLPTCVDPEFFCIPGSE